MRLLVLLTGLSLVVSGGWKLMLHHAAIAHPDALQRALQMRCYPGAVVPTIDGASLLHCWGCLAAMMGAVMLAVWLLSSGNAQHEHRASPNV